MSVVKPLVSIIIPTYNRAHLIGETLDSIIAQTYTNWECLVVDDGSTDNTDEVMAGYVAKDTRFKYHKRPDSKPKGANACRNIGLDKAVGEYIIFFDSDDLMVSDHLEVKVTGMQDTGCDYVIAKTKFFNSDKDLEHYYTFDKFEITPFNYVAQKLNWLTYDICLKTEIARAMRFNEQLQSGQEYNYFCKLVHLSTNAKFIDKIVTLRRYQENSTQGSLNGILRSERRTLVHLRTYIDIKGIASKANKEVLLWRAADCIQDVPFKNIPFSFWYYQFNEFGLNTIYLIFYYFTVRLSKRGYWFRSQFFRKRII